LVEAYKQDSSTSSVASEIPKRSANNAKVCVADWNGDGRPDLVVGDYVIVREGSSSRVHGFVWVYLRNAAEEGSGR
jgi:hypothetical protein